jgi:hypothetical protein
MINLAFNWGFSIRGGISESCNPIQTIRMVSLTTLNSNITDLPIMVRPAVLITIPSADPRRTYHPNCDKIGLTLHKPTTNPTVVPKSIKLRVSNGSSEVFVAQQHKHIHLLALPWRMPRYERAITL